jgi:hypothetical protein
MTKTRIVIAALLVLASASASLAATAGRAAPGVGWSNSGGLVPDSQAERDWFERASRPSNL